MGGSRCLGKLRGVLANSRDWETDPLHKLHERASEESDFDWDEEIAALEREGYVWSLPVVDRVLDVWDVVDALGWPAAQRLCRATFRGWEVEFLGIALAEIARVSQSLRNQREQQQVLAALGGSRRDH